MCGIAGLSLGPGAAPPSPARLAAIADALAHRGPDGVGSTVVGRVALLHCRLAIIDLAGGDQPLFGGHAALVANGEIYNDPVVRAGRGGVGFATGSDCETPLRLFLDEGSGYARGLRGMYAIAIHDRPARSLILSRDPFGIKPLYVAPLADGIAFASEPRALLRSGLVSARERPTARDELLQLGFTTGTRTIFGGIDRVLPGETLRIVDGHVLERTRSEAGPAGPPEPIGAP